MSPQTKTFGTLPCLQAAGIRLPQLPAQILPTVSGDRYLTGGKPATGETLRD